MGLVACNHKHKKVIGRKETCMTPGCGAEWERKTMFGPLELVKEGNPVPERVYQVWCDAPFKVTKTNGEVEVKGEDKVTEQPYDKGGRITRHKGKPLGDLVPAGGGQRRLWFESHKVEMMNDALAMTQDQLCKKWHTAWATWRKYHAAWLVEMMQDSEKMTEEELFKKWNMTGEAWNKHKTALKDAGEEKQPHEAKNGLKLLPKGFPPINIPPFNPGWDPTVQVAWFDMIGEIVSAKMLQDALIFDLEKANV